MKTNIAAIAAQHTIPAFSPDPETDIITDDGATGSSDNHEPNRKLVRLPGVDCSNQEHRFARERNANTFYSYKEKNRPVAIGRQEMLKIAGCHMQHQMYTFTFLRDTSNDGEEV